MSAISPDTFDARLQADDDLFVLDIRTEEAYEDWHIPGSENVPVLDQLRDDPEAALDAFSDLPDDEEIVTVCASGIVSQTATAHLRSRGYDARTLVDGMEGWSRVHRDAHVEAGIDGELIQVARPGTGCLSYVVVSDGEAAVFDPSQFTAEYEHILDRYDADLRAVFDTHAHADHVSGGRDLADRHDVPYYLHPADAADSAYTPIPCGELFEVGDVEITALHTPGHSPGGVTFAVEQAALLTGDTLFHDSVGRVELGVEAGLDTADVTDNAEKLYQSLQLLTRQPGDPLVLPAHDSGTPDPPVSALLSDVLEQNTDLHSDKEEFVAALSSDLPEQPPNFRRIKRINTGTDQPEGDDLMSLESGPNRCALEQ